MYPVLIIEGKEYPVHGISYYGNKIDNVSVTKDNEIFEIYVDARFADYRVGDFKVTDFSKNLIWKNANDSLIDKLDKRIESYEEILQDLATDFIEIYTNDDVLYKEEAAKAIQKDHQYITAKVDGLKEVKKIVLEL